MKSYLVIVLKYTMEFASMRDRAQHSFNDLLSKWFCAPFTGWVFLKMLEIQMQTKPFVIINIKDTFSPPNCHPACC